MAKESKKELEAVAATHRKAHQDAEQRLFMLRSRDLHEYIADGGTHEKHERDLEEAKESLDKSRRELSAAEHALSKVTRGELLDARGREIDAVLRLLDEAEAEAEKMADALQLAHRHGANFFAKRDAAARAFKTIGASGFDRIHRIHVQLDGNWHLEGLRADLESLGGLGAGAAFRERVRQTHAALRTPTAALKDEPSKG